MGLSIGFGFGRKAGRVPSTGDDVPMRTQATCRPSPIVRPVDRAWMGIGEWARMAAGATRLSGQIGPTGVESEMMGGEAVIGASPVGRLGISGDSKGGADGGAGGGNVGDPPESMRRRRHIPGGREADNTAGLWMVGGARLARRRRGHRSMTRPR
jgi:hypothetical protein